MQMFKMPILLLQETLLYGIVLDLYSILYVSVVTFVSMYVYSFCIFYFAVDYIFFNAIIKLCSLCIVTVMIMSMQRLMIITIINTHEYIQCS